jgi:anti-sigma factor RsiW
MTEQTAADQAAADVEREEIEKLLPWYVTGTLDCAERARVESYLARNPHTCAQLDLIRAEREQAVLANEALGSPAAAGALDRLMASLPTARPSLSQRLTGGSPFQRVVDFFTAPTGRGVRWAGFAAAAVVLVLAAAITCLLVRHSGTYQTAVGQSRGDGVSALIAFVDEARAPAIAGLLVEFDASIVDGPKPGGVYKIRLRTVVRPQSEKDALLRRLAERRDIVRVLLPSRD